jgi:hypothetical protein
MRNYLSQNVLYFHFFGEENKQICMPIREI